MTLPVMAGYVFLGLAFGLVAGTSGLDWWVPVLMSVLIYSGALEFAAVPMLGSVFDPIGSLIFGISLSARHLFYGIPMLKKYDGVGATKPFLIFGLTDETFSILSATEAPDGVSKKAFYFFVTLLDYLYWNFGTVLGVVFGNTVKVDLEGLDFVLTALFVVLFIEQTKTKVGLKSGVVGMAVSVLALIFFDASNFVLAAMVIMTVVFLAGRRVIGRE